MYLYGTVNRCGAYTRRRGKGELTFRACAAVNMHHACALACPADWKEQRRRALSFCAVEFIVSPSWLAVQCALYRGKGKSNLFRVYERGDLSASWYRKTYEWIRTRGHAVRSSNFLFRYVYTVFEHNCKPLHDCNFSLSDWFKETACRTCSYPPYKKDV